MKPETKKTNLHRAKSELTRERLLSSALLVMQENDVSHFSIQAVAKAAGMTSGAVQHHFPSKAALMMQVLSRLIDSLESSTDFWPSSKWALRRRADHFVQQAWDQLYSQPRFATAWSAYLASRDDKLMTAHIIEERTRIHQRIRAQFLAVFPEIGKGPQTEARVQFIFSSLRGLGLVNPFVPVGVIAPQLVVLSEFIQSLSIPIPLKTQETS
ncbi:MAG: TetR/AcrR family transcriptional regulator [Burkholderiaceae bacterium]